MVDVPIWARYGGSGLMFLATACGSGASSAPIPTSTPELPQGAQSAPLYPARERLAPTPEPHVIAASTRGCNLVEIDLLQEVLAKYLNPQSRGIYDQDFFNKLSRANDLEVRKFMNDHRVNNEWAYFWDLQPSPKLHLNVSLAEPMCRPGETYRATLTYSFRSQLLPEVLTEGEDAENIGKFDKPDRWEDVAREIFVLPGDMKWVDIKRSLETGESYPVGLRGVSLANDGTLTEVIIGHPSARMSVSPARLIFESAG